MNDDNFLTKFRESPRPEFADELYERINKPMDRQISPTVLFGRRAALTFAALLLLLATTLAVSPQARAIASQQWRQIGAIIFQDGTEPATSGPATPPPPTMPAPSESSIQRAASAAEASRLAGFTVLEPAFLPEGYTSSGEWSVDERDGSVYVVSTYQSADGSDFLTFNQIRYAPGVTFEQRYGDNETLQDVTVADHAGVWIEGRYMADPNEPPPADGAEPELLSTNWLVWEADGLTYILYGTGLERPEMMNIAESLAD